MKKILNLTLRKKWFDAIESGEKTVEYRAIKKHWTARLLDFPRNDQFALKKNRIWQFCLHAHNLNITDDADYDQLFELFLMQLQCKFQNFDHIQFTNGYGFSRPTMLCKIKRITIGRGDVKHGAPPDENVFRIELGDKIPLLKFEKPNGRNKEMSQFAVVGKKRKNNVLI